MCLFARDAARDIAEWLAFQFAVGFDACFVYDNGSHDATANIAWSFLAKHLDVRPIPWPVAAPHAQVQCYRDCLATAGSEFDWIAFIDADELIVPRRGSIKDLLAMHADTAAVVVNWAMFGSGGHAIRPPGMMIETFTRRAASDFPPNRIVKYIARPSRVTDVMAPCMFAVDGTICTPAGRAPSWHHHWVSTVTAEHEVAQVNHYFTRSEEEWRQKLTRGYRSKTHTSRLEGRFADFDRNDILDPGALRFLPEMHKTLAWIAAA